MGARAWRSSSSVNFARTNRVAPTVSVVTLAMARPRRHFWATCASSRSWFVASESAALACSGDSISTPSSTVSPVSAATWPNIARGGPTWPLVADARPLPTATGTRPAAHTAASGA